MSPSNRIPLFLSIAFASLLIMPDWGFAETRGDIDEQIDAVEDASILSPARKGNWVAVPIPVANPTLGAGLQLALLYLHADDGNPDTPNPTSAVGAMYTDTDSWGIAAFHDDYWKEDTYRFRAGGGTGVLNLDFYGIGDAPVFGDRPIAYALRFDAAMLQIQRRVPGTAHAFVGAGYQVLDSDITFKLSGLLPGLPDVTGGIRTAGMMLLGSYDTRDDNYYPNQGSLIELKFTDYADSWGSDLDYRKSRSNLRYYHSPSSDWVLAFKTELQTSAGRTPFFALSSLNMRGFPRDRYLADHSLSLHTEARHRFNARWGAVGFAETGWVADDADNLTDGRHVTAWGAGVRWRPTTAQTLNLGVDVAKSQDDSAVYVRIGEWF